MSYMEYHRDENREGIYNLYARNSGMVAQDILKMGGKDFAAGSGEGKNINEKAALAQIYSSLKRFEIGSIIGILINTLVKDYMDQTMPNAPYKIKENLRQSSLCLLLVGKPERYASASDVWMNKVSGWIEKMSMTAERKEPPFVDMPSL